MSLPTFSIVAAVIFSGLAILPYTSTALPSSEVYEEVFGASKYTFSVSSGGAARCNFLLAFSMDYPTSSWPACPKNTPVVHSARYFSVGSSVSDLVGISKMSGGYYSGAFADSILPAPINPAGVGSTKQYGLFIHAHRHLATSTAEYITSS